MSALPVLSAAGSVLLALLGEWRYRSLPELPPVAATGSLPSLSVIVPARNEAGNLPRLLASLRAERYPGPFEVIVVDDGSTDGTTAVAAAFGAHVLRLDQLPSGWLGKPNACHRGAALARGAWLLFTDADTVHGDDGPARAIAWALGANLDGLSIFPRQEGGVFGDRLVLAVAFAGYFAGLTRTAGLLNGQYILLRREVYEQSGGFASVRDQPLEDLALGRRLYALGYRVPVVRAGDVLRVRMYTDAGQMWHGLTRLAALSLRWSGAGSMLTPLFTVCTAAPVGTLVRALVARHGRRRALAVWLITCAGMFPWARRFESPAWTLLAPLAAAVIQAAGIWGLLNRITGRPIRWKGRSI
jgi:cellulose synthase/poly-beta-1,6-N-acetylglucosamine synthase-like glycosyltransferase